jgi:uncharacterized protein YbjT (DUF2867 family)
MRQRRVTVFGGSGFIGRHLVRRLAADGAVVRVAVRDVERAKFLKPMGAVGQVVPFPANIRDEAAVRRAIEATDEVVNLVAILSPWGAQTFTELHVRGAARIASAAADLGVGRLVHVSAIGADPDSPAEYGRSKAAGEAAVREAFPEATIVRPSIVFGPEDAFFNRFADMTRCLPALPLIDGGRTRFQPVYVGDVAEAIFRILERAGTRGQTYELGGPKTYSFRELLELMLREIGRKRLLLSLPSSIASLQASVLELMPNPMLTRDQVRLLQRDNVVAAGTLGLADLGIEPTPVEVILPTYLDRFRSGGRFARRNVAA